LEKPPGELQLQGTELQHRLQDRIQIRRQLQLKWTVGHPVPAAAPGQLLSG